MNSIKTRENSVKCQICGDKDSSPHFGVISCRPCKMFFKRNAEYIHKLSKCSLGEHCDVTVHNRHVCSSCRLKKCFNQGMKVEMFRSSRSRFLKQLTIEKKKCRSIKNISQSSPCKMDWELFENLIRSYDESQGIFFAENFLREQLILPIKFRFKTSVVRQFLLTLSRKSRLLFEENLDYLNLCAEDRLNVLRNSQIPFKVFSTLSIIRQCHFLDQTGFFQSNVNLFGWKLSDLMKNFLDQFDSDLNLMKLIFLMILFSNINGKICFYSQNIRQIHEKYIELIWKYLLSKSSYHQTVMFFSNLPRCLITFQNILDTFHQDKSLTDLISEEEN